MTTRETPQRREVVRALSRLQGFVSAQELHALIADGGGRIALATVYSQLKSLVASGEVDVVMTDRGESLYRRCVVDAHHHHLACRRCGRTIEVDAPDLEAWAGEVGRRHGFHDLRHVLELSGVCDTCAS